MPDLSTLALTAGLIVAGASGAQLVKSPEAWPRTVGAFGQRLADQTGFYIVQTGSNRLAMRALGWQADTARCPRAELLACAAKRTFTALDRDGHRRLHTPLIASIALGTGASVAWRPERSNNADTWAFVGTRLGIVFAGYVAERVLVDWWRGRNSAVPEQH